MFCVGYVYLVFESEKSVKALLQACTQRHLHPGDYLEYYYKMSSKRIRCKDVSITLKDILILLEYSLTYFSFKRKPFWSK